MGAVFAVFAGFYYWIGKITGYAYPETLGKIHFWSLFIGVFKIKLAPNNLAWCWNIYSHKLFYMISNPLGKICNYFVEENKGINIENNNLKKFENSSNRQSAGVCKLNNLTNLTNLTASQRIHAKDLWYILGFIEGDGCFNCFKEKQYLRAEMVIGLEEADIKLLYWIKKQLGCGSIKCNNYSKSAMMVRNPNALSNPKVARYIIRSKIHIIELLNLFTQYPALTKNKKRYILWTKECIKTNSLLPKFKIDNSINNIDFNQEYIKDWIVGFIEANGCFYITEYENKEIAGFNISQKDEEILLTELGKIIGLSNKNKISIKADKQCILTAISIQDLQAVINFLTQPDRVRLKGLKRVKFLLWLSKLRTSPKYNSLKIPNKY